MKRLTRVRINNGIVQESCPHCGERLIIRQAVHPLSSTAVTRQVLCPKGCTYGKETPGAGSKKIANMDG